MFNKTIDFTTIVNDTGVYVCSTCNNILFDAAKKFDVGCGFPSFWQHADKGVKRNPLNTYNRSRIQLLCNRCGVHLGHLFPHNHTPSRLRYCIIHNVLTFTPSGGKQLLVITNSINNSG